MLKYRVSCLDEFKKVLFTNKVASVRKSCIYYTQKICLANNIDLNTCLFYYNIYNCTNNYSKNVSM